MPCIVSLRAARVVEVCFLELIAAPVVFEVENICLEIECDDGDMVCFCLAGMGGRLVVWVRTADIAGMISVVPAVSSMRSRSLSLDHEGGLSWEGT